MSSVTRDQQGRVIAYSATVGTLVGEIECLAAQTCGYRISTPYRHDLVSKAVRRNAAGKVVSVRADHGTREKAAVEFRNEQRDQLISETLAWMERIYWHAENGMYAFLAADYARSEGHPAPNWASDYFADIGNRLWSDESITEKLLVVRRSDVKKDARCIAAARVFLWLTTAEGLGRGDATEIVGDWLDAGKTRQNTYKKVIKPFLQLLERP